MQYEFDQSQNQLIRDLSQKMRFVSYFLIGLGVLAAIGGVLTLTRGGIGTLIQGVINVIIGVWTGNAASAFHRIVETQGNDMENLMLSLGELRKLYALQYWCLIIAIVFMALGLVLALVSGVFSAGR